MGFWSTLGAIGGAVAAPFTGGASLIPSLIGAGTSALDLIGANKASNSAQTAARLQAAAADKSNQLLGTAQGNAEDFFREGQGQSYDALLPYLSSGAQANTQLQALMSQGGLPGFTGQLNTPSFNFQAPNPQDVLNDPAIQFQMDQGQKAIERSAASRGGINSGATLQRVNANAQGIAAQGYNDLFSRDLTSATANWQNNYQKAMDDFNSAFGIYKDTRNTNLGLLNTALQSGQGAASQVGNQALQTGNLLGTTRLSTAGAMGANLQGGANAQAAGQVRAGNAWSNAFSDIGKNIMNLYTLNKQSGSGGGGQGPVYGNFDLGGDPNDGSLPGD